MSWLTSFIHLLFYVYFWSLNPLFATDVQQHVIPIQPGERWWAGVIADAHLFPISQQSYQFDFCANTAGNQGQPLLLSTHGRFVWSDDPFAFQFDGKDLTVTSKFNSLQIGQQGETLKEVYSHVSQKYFPPSGSIPASQLFTHPQFNTWIEFTYQQNQKGILEYARKIAEHGFPPGVFMIDEGWFVSYGQWQFDPVRFPDPHAMMKELKSLGFKVLLWVCPYMSPDGPFWKERWLDFINGKETIWILNTNNTQFPAVMQWWDGFSNVIDLSHPQGLAWFNKQLDFLVETYGIDGFKFDGGDAVHYSQQRFLSPTVSYDKEITPNEHSELFVKLGLDYPFNEYRAAWKMAGQPIAMRLRDKRHDWEDVQKLVPGSIAQGLMGYPFTCPDMIGGGEYLSFIDLESVDQELIVRAAQCHALMPMMQFSVAPWRVLDEKNLHICVEMAQLHTNMGDEIVTLAKESAKTGEPIVRSLDYEFPNNGYEEITDQFLLGSSILVAPVVEKGARTRTVVFPPGTWKDQEGMEFVGPSMEIVEAPLEKLPWFRKVKTMSPE
ncbi:alpha-galactosidase [candidate division KSB1 bacterium]|nr:alpha-galactosidase [candidate division KSB1 bacterium]